MSENNAIERFEVFHDLCSSLVAGIHRIYRARIINNIATRSILTVKVIDPPKEGPVLDYVDKLGLTEVSRSEFDTFEYVSSSSYLILSTALFDTFLSDVTKFLFMCYPAAIKESLVASYDDIIKTKSINDLMSDLITRKAKSISYNSFDDRLSFLKKTFNLKLDISKDLIALLKDISSVRNAIAHDQSFLDVKLDDNCKIVTVKKGCPHHPIPSKDLCFEEAWFVYISISKSLYKAVVNQVIKHKDEDKMNDFLKILAEDMFIKTKMRSEKQDK